MNFVHVINETSALPNMAVAKCIEASMKYVRSMHIWKKFEHAYLLYWKQGDNYSYNSIIACMVLGI